MCRVFSYKIPQKVPPKERGKFLKHGHAKQTVMAWAKQTGLSEETIRDRLRREWSIEQALTMPIRTRIKKPSRYAELSVQTGLPVSTIKSRLKRGWTVKQVLTVPVMTWIKGRHAPRARAEGKI
jgi:lambda repressor-like predicted transcriptional regulator